MSRLRALTGGKLSIKFIIGIIRRRKFGGLNLPLQLEGEEMKKLAGMLVVLLASSVSQISAEDHNGSNTPRSEAQFIIHNNFGLASASHEFGTVLVKAGALDAERSQFGFVGAGKTFYKKTEARLWKASTWIGAGFSRHQVGPAGGISVEGEGHTFEVGSQILTLGQQFTEHGGHIKSWQTLSVGEPLGEACFKKGRLCLGGEVDWLLLRNESIWGFGPELKVRLPWSLPKIALASLRNTRGFWEFKLFTNKSW